MISDEDHILKLSRIQRELLEQFTKLGGLVNELRASVNVLKLYVAMQLSPEKPELALEALAEMERELLRTSSDEQERLRSVELIQALKDLKKHGPRGGSA